MGDSSYVSYQNLIQQLEKKVYIDSLTQAYNRRYFDEMKFIPKEDTFLSSVALIIGDIRNFKQINDTYGHLTGDNCLRELSLMLLKHIHANDTIIRYGGDEFLIILFNQSEAQVCERIALLGEKAHKISFPKYPDLHLTLDMGYSFCEFPNPSSQLFYNMLNCADKNMYQNKKGS